MTGFFFSFSSFFFDFVVLMAFLFVACSQTVLPPKDDDEGEDPVSVTENKRSSAVQSSSSADQPSKTVDSSDFREWDWSLPRDSYLNPDIEYGILTDSRDKREYKTVQIGEMTWMAQNLNYKYKDNDVSFCYDGREDYCDIVGRLYTWDAVQYSENICPKGWHVPSREEFIQLLTDVGGTVWNSGDTIAPALKSKIGWRVIEGHDGKETDEFGFSAIAAGQRPEPGVPHHIGGLGTFRSSTEYGDSSAFVLDLNTAGDWAFVDLGPKTYAFSIRCVKD